jgi:hypothetical protein
MRRKGLQKRVERSLGCLASTVQKVQGVDSAGIGARLWCALTLQLIIGWGYVHIYHVTVNALNAHLRQMLSQQKRWVQRQNWRCRMPAGHNPRYLNATKAKGSDGIADLHTCLDTRAKNPFMVLSLYRHSDYLYSPPDD